jgi:O-antigen ligase
VSFNHTSQASRLRAPLEYWNALALVMVLAIPIALRMTTDATRRDPTRLLGIFSLFVLVVCLGMTYSRGGILAFMAVVAVVTLFGGQRLRGLAVIGVVIVAAIPVLGLSFSRPALKGLYVPLEERVPDGILLGLVSAGCILALLIAAWGMLRLEERTVWNDERTQLVWRGLAATAAILFVMLLGAIAAYEGGPGQWADDAWNKFTETSKDNTSDPARIVSSNSGNRWVWWKEAAGAWSDKPLQGWGAGSFAVTHKMYREVELPVVQPHNMPLQFLAETGIVGTLLVTGALGFLLFCAFERVRAMAHGRERDIAVALFAGAVGWVVHGLVDWDWDIPGVTIPALIFLGLLVGRPWRPRSEAALPDRATGTRGALIALACVAACLLIVSAALPMLADQKATDAQAVSANAGAGELEDAAAEADLAARLDPTAVRPLLAASAIAQGRGRLLDAREFLLDAVDRQPYSAVAWQRLLELALKTADRQGARAAARRLLELDPIGTATRTLAGRLVLFEVPAAGSPTATGTPLSPRYNGGPAVAPTPPTGTTVTPGATVTPPPPAAP